MLAGARLEAVEQHGIGRALLALQFQFRIIQDQVAVISNAQFRANLHDNLGACARYRHEITSLLQFHFSRTIQMDAQRRQKDASHFSTPSPQLSAVCVPELNFAFPFQFSTLDCQLPCGSPVTETQCRKCRIPVNTMAKPRRSATAITSASRTEPPGWITAVAPALAASSTPSGNGKNASEATTHPASGDCAFMTAILTESTRLICPAPTPSVAPSFAKTIALDFTCFATFNAKRIVCSSSAVGARFVTVRNSSSFISPRSGFWTSMPPRMRLS